MIDLSGTTALVTGSSRGIGAAIARQLAQLGARVAVHYSSNREAAEATLASLEGGPHALVTADISDPEAVEAMVAAAITELGGLDILVNNAAVHAEHKISAVTYDEWQDSWRRIIDANLIGTANVTYCVVQQMLRQGRGGRIVTITSRGAFRGEPDHPAYGASKAGLNSMSGSLAKHLAPHGITVTAVAPGYVETEMVAPMLAGAEGEAIRSQYPTGQVATPEEVARVVAFLAADGAASMAGEIVDVNGASYLRS